MKSFKKAFRKGFSLIELSVVLIIIGLLMAAIMKGRDLIRSAEFKKFYNTFVKAWELAYTQYYDRTGMPLGGPLYVNDTETNNKLKLADYVGANYTFYNSTNSTHPAETDLVFRSPDEILKRAKDVGLELPNTGLNKEYKYRVTFTDADYSTVWITFGSDPVQKDEKLRICLNDTCNVTDNLVNLTGKGNARGNFMLMVNVPYDVAAQIDRIIDGRADGTDGNVVCVAYYSKPVNVGTINKTTINASVNDINEHVNCPGSLHWGNKENPYVTLMYKLGI